jgi:hypothetical protein
VKHDAAELHEQYEEDLYGYAAEVTDDPDAALIAIRSRLYRYKGTEVNRFLKWCTKIIASLPGYLGQYAPRP